MPLWHGFVNSRRPPHAHRTSSGCSCPHRHSTCGFVAAGRELWWTDPARPPFEDERAAGRVAGLVGRGCGDWRTLRLVRRPRATGVRVGGRTAAVRFGVRSPSARPRLRPGGLRAGGRRLWVCSQCECHRCGWRSRPIGCRVAYGRSSPIGPTDATAPRRRVGRRGVVVLDRAGAGGQWAAAAHAGAGPAEAGWASPPSGLAASAPTARAPTVPVPSPWVSTMLAPTAPTVPRDRCSRALALAFGLRLRRDEGAMAVDEKPIESVWTRPRRQREQLSRVQIVAEAVRLLVPRGWRR